MIDTKGIYRCDREIGSPKKGWHSCKKPATTRVAGFAGIELHACDECLPILLSEKNGYQVRCRKVIGPIT